ncbi:MAG: DEAD/DEAH box helicase [Rhodopirellula sp.]|nr:DEAD/DEAH box helicase [Rhodopirellula sp.]
MRQLTGREQEFVDVLARVLDPPLADRPDDQELPAEQRVEARFRQLPYTVEYAVLDWLNANDPALFNKAPVDRFSSTPPSYRDAGPGLNNAGTYYAGPSYIIDYQISRAYVERLNRARAIALAGVGSAQVDAWMRHYGLYEAAEDNPDPHFAERAFVVNVLVPAFGHGILSRVRPGREFPDYPYVVDFLVETAAGGVVLEVDGREYHDPACTGHERFESDLRRQNRIQALGYPVFRYPARRILREPGSVIAELKQNLPQLDLRQTSLFEPSASAPLSPPPFDGVALADEYAICFRPMQVSLLLALRRSLGKDVIRIWERAAPRCLTEIALHDLALLIGRLQSLFGVEILWPKCVLIRTAPDAAVRPLLERFRNACTLGPDRFSTPAFELSPEDFDIGRNFPDCDLIVDLQQEGRIPLVPEGSTPDVLGRESLNLPVIKARLSELTLPRGGKRSALRPQSLDKKVLDSFARRFLRVPSIHHYFDKERPKTQERQYELLCRVLAGQDAFGIMPTGRGKSLVFQLAAMLLPGGALVISPLRALMRDQVDDLRLTRGWNCVRSIRYDQRADAKEQAIADFIGGSVRLLYVSPERLQEMKFATRLACAAVDAHISFVAIDEAHCVSEWGHDFRLSYMEIPRFLQVLRERQERLHCPIVALTATASQPVQRDVCGILGLTCKDVREGGNVVAEDNVDRTELSLSVHTVEGHEYPTDRQKLLRTVLIKMLPRALQRNHQFRWDEFVNGKWRGRGAGVIFCLYKNSHGQTSWHESVGAVRDHLLAHEVLEDGAMRLYAAESPDFCPECERAGRTHYTIRNVPKTEDDGKSFECSCGHRFTVPLHHEDWHRQLADTQYRFKKNDFPLLVTTKAYGMGIDHRGLRFVVHYGLPGSLESYYQEIGRAGRDDNHAHCALLVRMPAPRCEKLIREDSPVTSYLEADEGDILPPCLFAKYRQRRQCPAQVGLPEPCDLSRQLVMLLKQYQKPDSFAKGCAELWEELVAKGADANGRVAWYVPGGSKHDDKTQRHQNYLFRLQQLGLVRCFTLEYVPRSRSDKGRFDVRFHIQMPDKISLGAVVRNLRKCIEAIQALNSGARNQHRGIGKAFSGSQHDDLSRENVEVAIRYLFAWTRAHVLKMRLESFAKLLRYIASDNACRRKELLGAMTGQIHGDDSYRCEFCDSTTCVPDLRFKRPRAQVAPDARQFRDLFAKVDEVFITQDLTDAAQVIEEAIDRGVIEGLQHQATGRVESDPDNPAANLVAAEAFAAKERPDMHRYFRNFARIANAELNDAALAKHGYERYRKHAPADAVRAFAVAGSAFDSAHGLSQLSADAAVAGLDASEQDNLAVALLAEAEHQSAQAATAMLSAIDEFLK